MRIFQQHALWLVLAISVALIVYFSEQSNFLFTFSFYSIAFVCYLLIYLNPKNIGVQQWEKRAIILFLIPLFSTPTLSPDFYRFLWDGEITTFGIHPYAYTPNEIIEKELIPQNEYVLELYANITELSRQHYSPYPTINQLYFLIPAWISNNIMVSLVIMRILVFGTLLLGYMFLKKLIDTQGIQQKKLLLLLLNPFLVIEIMDNLHFEGVMIAWLIIGVYFLNQQKWIQASFYWSIAITVKLTPLVLLPVFLRFFSLKRSVLIYLYIAIITLGITAIYLWPPFVPNVLNSIRLYFNNFEFNASILPIVKFLVSPFTVDNPTLIAGPVTVGIGTIIILLVSWAHPIKSYNGVLKKFMWIYLVYLLFATTVHPWYIILPLTFSIFSEKRFIVIWTFLIMLSYGFYHWTNTWISEALIITEYLILLLVFTFESPFKKKIKQLIEGTNA